MKKTLLRRKRFWGALIFLLLIVIVRSAGIDEYITLENIRYHKEIIAGFIARRYWTSVAIFWCLYVIENILALPAAAFLTLAAGFFYGVIPAVMLTIFSATSGAIILFYIARYFFGESLQRKYASRLANFNRSFNEYGVYYLLGVRCVPLIPFVVVNVFAGLTLIPLTTFIWTTAVGIIPVTLVYALAGQQLQSIHSVGDIFSIKVMGLLLLFAFLALLPVIVQHYRNNNKV